MFEKLVRLSPTLAIPSSVLDSIFILPHAMNAIPDIFLDPLLE